MAVFQIVRIEKARNPKTQQLQVQASTYIDGTKAVLVMDKNADWWPLPGVWLVEIGRLFWSKPTNIQKLQFFVVGMKPILRIMHSGVKEFCFAQHGEELVESKLIGNYFVDFVCLNKQWLKPKAGEIWLCEFSSGELLESGVIRLSVLACSRKITDEEWAQMRSQPETVELPEPEPETDPVVAALMQKQRETDRRLSDRPIFVSQPRQGSGVRYR
jgi:hypothetical protein